MSFEDDFIKGQQDCREGIPHTAGTDAYNRGYATQYEAEQAVTANGLRHEHN